MASSLTYSELIKRAGRSDLFVDKFNNGEKFVFEDASSSKIDKVIIGKTEYLPSDSVSLKTIFNAKPDIGRNLKLVVGGKKLGFGKLSKTKEFGGDSGGKSSFGGKATEVLSETGFCFYYAMLVNGKLNDYDPEVWSGVKKTQDIIDLCGKFGGLSGMLNDQFNDVKEMNSQIHKMRSFLVEEGWHDILISQVKKFKSSYPNVGTSYNLSRPSAIPDSFNPYYTYRILAKTMQEYALLERKVGEDKWNPADFWIYNQAGMTRLKSLNDKAKKLTSMKGDDYKVSYMNEVNKEIYQLYKENLVYPVSLKKSSSPNIHEINVGGDITQIVKYTKGVIGMTNQDSQLHFEVSTYKGRAKIESKKMVAKYKTASAGFALELEYGSNARHGKIGRSLQEFIIKETDDTGIKEVEKVRKKFKNLDQHFPADGSSQWIGVSTYTKSMNEQEVLIPYLQELMKKVHPNVDNLNNFTAKYGKDKLAIGTKTGASELAVAVDQVKNKLSRDIVVENLYKAAGSGGVGAGLTEKQLKDRQRLLGLSKDDVVSLKGSSKAGKIIFEGCFHIKIM